MNTFKRKLRQIGFIVLIILASVGVGLTGGIPIPKTSRKKETHEIAVEKVDEENDESKKQVAIRS